MFSEEWASTQSILHMIETAEANSSWLAGFYDPHNVLQVACQAHSNVKYCQWETKDIWEH